MTMALLRMVILCVFLGYSWSFKWKVDDIIQPTNVLTLSERFMFATGNGPVLLEQEQSSISVNTKVTVWTTDNSSTNVEYVIYSTDYDHRNDAFGLCGDTLMDNKWATNALKRTVPTYYHATTKNMATGQILYVWEANLRKDYEVRVEAWHNVAFQLCTYESRVDHAGMQGEVAFRNPYGYIPAELYGIRPFEAARTIMFVLFTAYFLYFYVSYKDTVLPLHHAIFGVLLVALVEAAMWFAAYQSINHTGHPYCCPFPPEVVAALVMQIFRQTTSRTLLLVVSLGYGIVRPKLLRAEWIAIVVITLMYFSIATTYEVSNIIALDVHPTEVPASAGMIVPSMLIDMVFLTWIYLALTSTIRILTEFQQTHKLEMYNRLFSTIAAFSVLFILVSLVMSMKTSGVLKFPWQWNWLQQVAWEVLNFAVLAAVCIICKPSDTSQMLSYVAQLPQDDPDDLDEEMHERETNEAHEGGSVPRKAGGYAQDMHQQTRSQFSSNYALPEADDEFGLEGDVGDEDDML